MTHKYRGSIIALSISKSVEPNEEPSITNMDLMIQHSSHTSNKNKRKLNLSEYRQLQMKKAEKPDYLQDPPKGTRL